MIERAPLCPQRVRTITGSFAFIEHRFLRDGFWATLSHHELLLYLFLVLVADRQGLSYYGFDKICSLLRISPDEYLVARNALIHKDLIAFDGHLFQVLSLPDRPVVRRAKPLATTQEMAERDSATIRQLLRLTLGGAMIDKRTIFDIHRRANEGLSVRKIAKTLRVSRKSVCRYLKEPTL